MVRTRRGLTPRAQLTRPLSARTDLDALIARTEERAPAVGAALKVYFSRWRNQPGPSDSTALLRRLLLCIARESLLREQSEQPDPAPPAPGPAAQGESPKLGVKDEEEPDADVLLASPCAPPVVLYEDADGALPPQESGVPDAKEEEMHVDEATDYPAPLDSPVLPPDDAPHAAPPATPLAIAPAAAAALALPPIPSAAAAPAPAHPAFNGPAPPMADPAALALRGFRIQRARAFVEHVAAYFDRTDRARGPGVLAAFRALHGVQA